MMRNIKRSLFILAVAVSCGAQVSKAQDIVVCVRPERPHYERVVAPSPRHIWIDEEWEARDGRYVFVGGHWSEPPDPGWMWVPGCWKESPRGSFWVRGRWRHRQTID